MIGFLVAGHLALEPEGRAVGPVSSIRSPTARKPRISSHPPDFSETRPLAGPGLVIASPRARWLSGTRFQPSCDG